MQIVQLECFISLSETLNFSITAQVLHISQPAVSYQIKALENELNLKLIKRTRRNVELTPAGLSFYNDAKDLISRLNIGIVNARSLSEKFKSTFSIGYEGNQEEIKNFPEIIRTFRKKNPHVYINLKTVEYSEKYSLIASNKLDVIFSDKESIEMVTNMCYEELFIGKFVCVMPKSHPFVSHTTIAIEELCSQPLVLRDTLKCPPPMRYLQKKLQDNNYSHIYFTDSLVLCYTMIKSEFGIGILPDFKCLQDNDLTAVPLSFSDMENKISYGIAWRKNSSYQELTSFVSIVKSVFERKF
jgi:LysR family hca operon transcriptional activator